MSCLHYPTDNLLRGRRRLEEIEEIVILQDWTWDDTSNRFFMRISISIDEEHPDIPQNQNGILYPKTYILLVLLVFILVLPTV